MTLQTQKTLDFILQYEDTTVSPVDGTALLKALSETCDGDFGTLVGVFGGTRPATPITVTVNLGGGGTNNGKDMTIGSGGEVAGGPFDRLRNTFIAELAEVFMQAQQKKWNRGDSKGEALSRALGGVMYPDGQQPGFTVHQWIDNGPDPALDAKGTSSASGRQDWVSQTFPGDIPAKSTGCGVAFLFYLRSQLGFSWARIVSAAADTFEGVYQQLTGSVGAWAPFIAAIDQEFPPGSASELNGSATRPFSDGLEQTATEAKPSPRGLVSPDEQTVVPLRTARQISVRRYLRGQEIHGNVGLRALATQAAQPMGSQLSHDPLSRVGLRGLLNGQRSVALD